MFIPNMDEFFAKLDAAGHRYVVLRGWEGYDKAYPGHGAKEDIDLLVDDAALPFIAEHHGHVKKRHGTKCDFYNTTGWQRPGRAFDWRVIFPPALAEAVLSTRVKWKEKFYVPAPRTHFFSLIYHIAYQKAERAKIHYDDASQSTGSKYISALSALKRDLKIEVPNTLSAYHALLKQEGYAITYEHLVGILQNDFTHHYKSFFLAKVMDEYQGELNLFVIRKVAVKKGFAKKLIETLEQHYEVIAVKEIPWMVRWQQAKNMRGGKWKRGGKPHIAVVVFDKEPQATKPGEGTAHPFVFNARQFFKPALREWFTKEARTNPKDNPIHSTDNEAEAVGHLHFFFTRGEQNGIFAHLKQLRGEL